MIISRSHDCPFCGDAHDNSCYIVYDDGYKCFSCGISNKKSIDSYAYKNKELISNVSRLFVPKNTNKIQEFSNLCLKWLYSYYVYDDIIRKYNIAYCEDNSLLYPIWTENGILLEYHRRFFPKNFFSTSGIKKTIFKTGKFETDTLIIVEDYISCVRMGEIENCLCLFGTSINETLLNYCTQYSKIVIWLDNDTPGIVASSKIYTKIIKKIKENITKYPQIYVKEVQIKQIVNEKSPKELPNQQIKSILEMG